MRTTLVTTCDNCGVFDIYPPERDGPRPGECPLCGSVRIWVRALKGEVGGKRLLEGHDRLLDVTTGEVLSEEPEASPMAMRTFGKVLERVVRAGNYTDVEVEK